MWSIYKIYKSKFIDQYFLMEIIDSLNKELIDKSILDNHPIIVSPFGIGDTILICGMLEGFSKLGYPKPFIVAPSSHKDVVELYSNLIAGFLILEKEQKENLISNASLISEKNYISLKPGNVFIPHPAFIKSCRLDQFTKFNDVPQTAYYSAMFDLDLDFKFNFRHFCTEEENSTIFSKDVLLIPHSNSWPEVGYEFWLELSKKLIKKGFKILINSNEYKINFEKEQIYCEDVSNLNIKALSQLSSKIPFIIGSMCGLMNLLVDEPTNSRKTMISKWGDISKPYEFGVINLESPYPYITQEKFNDREVPVDCLALSEENKADILEIIISRIDCEEENELVLKNGSQNLMI